MEHRLKPATTGSRLHSEEIRGGANSVQTKAYRYQRRKGGDSPAEILFFPTSSFAKLSWGETITLRVIRIKQKIRDDEMASSSPEERRRRTILIKQKALELGFDRVGIAPAEPPPHTSFLDQWLSSGFAGKMEYMERYREKRKDPREILPNARSVICVLLNYYTGSPPPPVKEPYGRVARYAWGEDYHEVMKEKLWKLVKSVEAITQGRVYVDTGPVLERDLASRAGLGWIGKHTNLIHRDLGSWVFLGEIITDAELEYDEPVKERCGRCSRCIPACPTGAIVAPYKLDARRCISYLTIELRGSIPKELRPLIGNWVFGCDLCQEVCPWNRRAKVTQEDRFQPARGVPFPNLVALLNISEEEFRQLFRNSPIKRAKRQGIRRNAAVALGNLKDPRAIPALAQALKDHDPVVRESSAWALGQIGTEEAWRVLEAYLPQEEDPQVRSSMEEALYRIESGEREVKPREVPLVLG